MREFMMSRCLQVVALSVLLLSVLTGCDRTREQAKSQNVPYDGIIGVWSVPPEILEAGQRHMEEYLMNSGSEIDLAELPRIESFDILILEDSIAMFNLLSSPIGAFEPCYIGFGTSLDYLTSSRYRLEISLADFVAALTITLGGGLVVDEGQQPDQPEDIELPFDPEDLVNAPGMVGITIDIDTIDPETLEIALVKIDSSAFQTRLPNGRQLGQSDMQFIRSRTRPDEFTNFCEIPDQTMAAASKQLIIGVAHQIAANNNGSR